MSNNSKISNRTSKNILLGCLSAFLLVSCVQNDEWEKPNDSGKPNTQPVTKPVTKPEPTPTTNQGQFLGLFAADITTDGQNITSSEVRPLSTGAALENIVLSVDNTINLKDDKTGIKHYLTTLNVINKSNKDIATPTFVPVATSRTNNTFFHSAQDKSGQASDPAGIVIEQGHHNSAGNIVVNPTANKLASVNFATSSIVPKAGDKITAVSNKAWQSAALAQNASQKVQFGFMIPKANNTFRFTMLFAVMDGNKLPTADFTYKPTAPTAGQKISFDAKTLSKDIDGKVAKYVFNFGDGSKEVTNTTGLVDYAFAKAGSYKVNVYVVDDKGAKSAVKTKEIKISANTGEIKGVILDGYIIGANIFWDCNGNRKFDAGEISTQSTAGGKYRIARPSNTSCRLLADIPIGAIDTDSAVPVLKPYQMEGTASTNGDAAPYTVISPMTTLLEKTARDQAITLDKAKKKIVSVLPPTVTTAARVFGDYLKENEDRITHEYAKKVRKELQKDSSDDVEGIIETLGKHKPENSLFGVEYYPFKFDNSCKNCVGSDKYTAAIDESAEITEKERELLNELVKYINDGNYINDNGMIFFNSVKSDLSDLDKSPMAKWVIDINTKDLFTSNKEVARIQKLVSEMNKSSIAMLDKFKYDSNKAIADVFIGDQKAMLEYLADTVDMSATVAINITTIATLDAGGKVGKVLKKAINPKKDELDKIKLFAENLSSISNIGKCLKKSYDLLEKASKEVVSVINFSGQNLEIINDCGQGLTDAVKGFGNLAIKDTEAFKEFEKATGLVDVMNKFVSTGKSFKDYNDLNGNCFNINCDYVEMGVNLIETILAVIDMAGMNESSGMSMITNSAELFLQPFKAQISAEKLFQASQKKTDEEVRVAFAELARQIRMNKINRYRMLGTVLLNYMKVYSRDEVYSIDFGCKNKEVVAGGRINCSANIKNILGETIRRGYNLEYFSENSEIAVVNKDGLNAFVVGKKEGKTGIYAKSDDVESNHFWVKVVPSKTPVVVDLNFDPFVIEGQEVVFTAKAKSGEDNIKQYVLEIDGKIHEVQEFKNGKSDYIFKKTFKDPSKHEVKLYAVNKLGAKSKEVKKEVVVQPRLVADFTFSHEKPILNQKFTIDAKTLSKVNKTAKNRDDKIVKYVFNFGDGSKEVTNTTGLVEYAFAKTGSYKVNVRVIDDKGIVSAKTVKTVEAVHAVCTGDFTIDEHNTQEDIKAVRYCNEIAGSLKIYRTRLTNLDGLKNLTKVGGDLIVDDNDRLTNLDGLKNLTTVDAILNIKGNNNLTSLDGLKNLTKVGGDLRVIDNERLTNLDGLSNITTIGGDLIVSYNNRLTNLDGLKNITTVGGDLIVSYSDRLTNLDGLKNITTVGGDLIVSYSDRLTNLDGLKNITTFDGAIIIDNNSSLTNLDGLKNITTVGSLHINGNNNLTNLDGLKNITTVDAILNIKGNNNLTSLDGLKNITTVEFLYIVSNHSLTNLDGLKNLTTVDGTIIIDNNSSLTNLDSLKNLTTVDTTLKIVYNDSLTNLDGLKNLTTVDSLYINGNNSLTNLDGLKNLTTVDSLYINGNNSLTNLDGLKNLTTVRWKLNVSSNDRLTNLDGLKNLTTVVNLHINGNNSLTNLDGLKNITTVEFLYIVSNHSLTNLDGLKNFTTVDRLHINGNNSLTNLDGLKNFTTVDAILHINGNNNLTNLDGLKNLTTVGSLNINGNNNLTNLDGLKNLTTVGRLHINGNNNLTNLDGLRNIKEVKGGYYRGIYDNPKLDCTPYNNKPFAFFPLTYSIGNKVNCTTK